MATSEGSAGADRAAVPAVLLSRRPAAAYLTIGERTLKTLVASGAIPVVQVSPGRIAFRISDLDAYIAAQRR
jgi:excisionase family DNA binding protein